MSSPSSSAIKHMYLKGTKRLIEHSANFSRFPRLFSVHVHCEIYKVGECSDCAWKMVAEKTMKRYKILD